MISQDGKTISSWWSEAQIPEFAPLDSDKQCDVCVVGAGIAGLSVAYELVNAGKKVIVVDDSQVGDGQTGRTSAHLSSEWDDRYAKVERSLGPQAAQQIYQSHSRAIDTIEQIAQREQIDCDFKRVDGWLFLDPSNSVRLLDEELDAARRAGFFGAEKQPRLPLPNFESGPCLRFPNQGQFHPLKYLGGLVRSIIGSGGEIYCGDRIIDVQGTDAKKNDLARATSQRGPVVRGGAIVVCTNTPAPINDWMGIYTKQASYRTFVIGAKIPKNSIPQALYWDTADPYHYVRVQPVSGEAFDVLLIGGEDHKTGQPQERDAPFFRLEQWARPKFSMMGEIVCRWSGQVQEPADSVAFIGRAPHAKPDVYVATGDSGMGLTHGVIAGLLISDLILGKSNSWESLYDPSRKPVGAAGEFVKENLNVAEQYAKFLTGGEVSDVSEIAPDSGAVIREGLKKVAIYRDAGGAIHKMSPVCTHLGCIVAWNDVEKSWDCPCHGTRYSAEGSVVMGPAISDLPAISDEK